jgi:hypothetical protein
MWIALLMMYRAGTSRITVTPKGRLGSFFYKIRIDKDFQPFSRFRRGI